VQEGSFGASGTLPRRDRMRPRSSSFHSWAQTRPEVGPSCSANGASSGSATLHVSKSIRCTECYDPRVSWWQRGCNRVLGIVLEPTGRFLSHGPAIMAATSAAPPGPAPGRSRPGWVEQSASATWHGLVKPTMGPTLAQLARLWGPPRPALWRLAPTPLQCGWRTCSRNLETGDGGRASPRRLKASHSDPQAVLNQHHLRILKQPSSVVCRWCNLRWCVPAQRGRCNGPPQSHSLGCCWAGSRHCRAGEALPRRATQPGAS